jgi:lysophospholipase
MRRRLLAILMLLSLAGCGDGGSRAPFAESRTPPSIAPRFYAPDGWAWGYVRVGDGPVQRYGVSATAVGPRATVLILPGYSEPAEKWFETTRRLNDDGYTVWVLERQGQGGSERLTSWRDIGHATSFDPDVAAVRAMIKVVIRPKGDTPLIVLGHAAGSLVALRAAETGLPSDGLILSSPVFELDRLPALKAPIMPIAQWMRRLKLGWLKDPREPGWRRDGPDGFALALTSDKVRGAVQQAWLTANPDLRMGSPSLGWLAAFSDAAESAQSNAGRVAAPALMLEAGKAQAASQTKTCKAMLDCREVRFPTGRSELHMESDAIRDVWLTEVEDFIHARITDKAQARKALPHAL